MKKLITLASIALLFSTPVLAQMGIGTTSPDPSSMLDVASDHSGFLAPRMTTVQRSNIVSPAEGLLVYDTDTHSFWYYKSGTWSEFLGKSDGWTLTGNTLSGNEFLGSTNSQPVKFYSDNIERARITPEGNLGIGVTNPTYKLEMNDSLRFNQYLVPGFLSGHVTFFPHVGGSDYDAIRIKAFWNLSKYITWEDANTPSSQGLRWDSLTVSMWSFFKSRNDLILLDSQINDPTMFFEGRTKRIGVGTYAPTNRFHIYATANPLRLEGLQTSTQNDVLVVDANGVVTKRSGNFSSGWLLTGNTGTNPSSDYLGTSDNEALVLKTNGLERMRLDGTSGTVGIGTTNGEGVLSLQGSKMHSQLWAGGGDPNFVNTVIRTMGEAANYTNNYQERGLVVCVPHLEVNTKMRKAITAVCMDYSLNTYNVAASLAFDGTNWQTNNRLFVAIDGYVNKNYPNYPENAETRAGAFHNLRTGPADFSIYSIGKVSMLNGYVGVGTSMPANQLHVTSPLDPLRLEGLQSSTQSDVLVVDANGVVTKRNGGFGSSWSLSGNVGTNPSTDYLGTSDNTELSIRTNGADRIRINTSGEVGIGTTSPSTTLDVNGTAQIGTNGTTLTNVIKATVNIDVPSIAAGNYATVTFSLTNANTISSVVISPALALNPYIIIAYARVSSAGTVEVRFHNISTSTLINPPAMDFYVTLIE